MKLLSKQKSETRSVTTKASAKPGLSRLEFNLFKELMYTHAGIRFSDAKALLMHNRLSKRLGTLGLCSFKQYYDLIMRPENADELSECLNVLTTNETFFFRHKEHWDFLAETLIPEWKAGHGRETKFRVWSAAASIGAEAYSAAMLLHELLPVDEGYRFSIDATDINQNVLDQAKRAEFDDYAVQKIDKKVLGKYFIHDVHQKSHRLKPEVASSVNFRRQNLLEPSRGAMYDLVFLCNVLIYFDEASKGAVMKHIVSRLRRGSYLFLGGADNIPAHKDQFERVKSTIHRKT